MYYFQNSRREFKVNTSYKEDKRKKETEENRFLLHKFIFQRNCSSKKKRSNDFSQLQQLHNSQMPLPAQSREKMTPPPKKKEHYRRLYLSEEKKTESGFLLKAKKGHF